MSRWSGRSTVLKYSVPVDDQDHIVRMWKGATIVHAACQHTADSVELWALSPIPENAEPDLVDRVFHVHGTGHPIPDDWQHVGTALALDGALVWHVMERP